MKDQDAFLKELEKLMAAYGVLELTYTNKDDGLHAYTVLREDWNIGYPRA